MSSWALLLDRRCGETQASAPIWPPASNREDPRLGATTARFRWLSSTPRQKEHFRLTEEPRPAGPFEAVEQREFLGHHDSLNCAPLIATLHLAYQLDGILGFGARQPLRTTPRASVGEEAGLVLRTPSCVVAATPAATSGRITRNPRQHGTARRLGPAAHVGRRCSAVPSSWSRRRRPPVVCR